MTGRPKSSNSGLCTRLLDLSDPSATSLADALLPEAGPPSDPRPDDFTDLTQTRTTSASPESDKVQKASPSKVKIAASGESLSPTGRPALKVVTAASAGGMPTTASTAPRTSVPRPQLSPPRRASSYTVRTPAENRYLSSRHVAAIQQWALSKKGFFEDEVLWASVMRSDRLPQPQSSQEAFDLEMLTLQVGEGVSKSNLTTANFSVLLLSLLSHMRFMRVMAYEGEWAFEAYNALFLVRLCVKYFIVHMNQITIHEQFEMDRTLPLSVPKEHVTSSFDSSRKPERVTLDLHVLQDRRLRAQQLIEELFQALIYAEPNTSINYDFYIESLNLLIVMASMQLRNERSEPSERLYFMEIVLDRLSHFAGGSMTRLLFNFVNRPPPIGPSGGMLYSAYSYLFAAKRPDTPAPSPVADKSALLFLILANQNPKHFANEFKEAIKRLEDTKVSAATTITSGDDATLDVSFRQIYQALSSTVASEESCLILYPLLVHNRSFRTYIMSRSDPESFVLPVLKTIYEFSEQKGNFPHLYMLLTMLLLLSQDADFLDGIQKITIQSHTWYTERVVKSIPLSGLCMLVLIRMVQNNLATHKDVYCHSLCTAILANLSHRVLGLNSVVSQRIVSFYELIAKRYLKLTNNRGSSENLQSATPWKAEPGETDFDTLIYGDLVALLLEMINSIVCLNLKHNPELVYALLQKRGAFGPFREMPRFRDLVENIDKVIAHFHKKLEETDLKILSTGDVGEVIDRATKTWSSSSLKLFSVLKFRYEESPQEWQFALPYVWQAVVERNLVYWDADSATLIGGFMDERTDNLDQIL